MSAANRGGDPAGIARGAGRSPVVIDQRGKLAEEPFDVQVTRDKVLVRFRGRLVRTLTGADADEIRAATAAGDAAAVQLLVARKTGNFKRGNER
jgi:hypothetical protein